MQLWTFLHIAAMFATVTIMLGSALMATWAIRRRDIEGLRTYFRMAPHIDRSGGIAFIAGIAFGFINAMTIGWDLLTGWLVAAYVLVIAILIVGGSIGPYLKRVRLALAASDEVDPEHISDDLEAELRRPNATITSALLTALILAVIYDMVAKPFI